jgi:hypothetical protein
MNNKTPRIKAMSAIEGTNTIGRRYAIDSCCRGAHVIRSAHILSSPLDVSKWKKMPTIEGISGHKLQSTKAGALAHIDGTALVTPKAGADLLSLMEIIKDNNGSFQGNKDSMTIKQGW